jgi:hypothetical protein
LLNFAGNHGHLQAVRLDHRGDAHGLLQRELPASPGHADRYSGINGQQILNKYSLLGLLVSSAMVWRTCSSMPPILVPASPVTLSSVGSRHRFHDGFGPGGNIDLERSAFGD